MRKVLSTLLLFGLLSPAVFYGQTARELKPARATDSLPGVSGEFRTALVIGNSAYRHTSKLANPVNDADDVAKALEESGFKVTKKTDMDKVGMARAIRAFGAELAARKGVGLFYYAGHGVEVKGQNYLLPVDADIKREVETEDFSVELNTVLRQMEAAGNGFNIVILDACRDNPFASGWTRSGGGGGGLSTVRAPTGTYISYSAAPGTVAFDGDGMRNSPFASALVANLRRPNLKLEDVFKATRDEVSKRTSGKQVPWDNSSIVGDFFFIVEEPKAEERRDAAAATSKESERPATETAQPPETKYHRLALRGVERVNAGDFDGAISDIGYAIELDGRNAPEYRGLLAQTYLKRGFRKLQEGGAVEALRDADAAIERAPGYAAAYNFKGGVLSQMGDLKAARANFDKAIELDPMFVTAYLNRADLLAKTGDKKASEADIRRAREINPDVVVGGAKAEKDPKVRERVEGLVRSAVRNVGSAKTDQAIQEISMAINLLPENPNLYLLRANAKFIRGYPAGAFQDLFQARNLGVKRLEGFLYDVARDENSRTRTADNFNSGLFEALLALQRADCAKGRKLAGEIYLKNPDSSLATYIGVIFSPSVSRAELDRVELKLGGPEADTLWYVSKLILAGRLGLADDDKTQDKLILEMFAKSGEDFRQMGLMFEVFARIYGELGELEAPEVQIPLFQCLPARKS